MEVFVQHFKLKVNMLPTTNSDLLLLLILLPIISTTCDDIRECDLLKMKFKAHWGFLDEPRLKNTGQMLQPDKKNKS